MIIRATLFRDKLREGIDYYFLSLLLMSTSFQEMMEVSQLWEEVLLGPSTQTNIIWCVTVQSLDRFLLVRRPREVIRVSTPTSSSSCQKNKNA